MFWFSCVCVCVCDPVSTHTHIPLNSYLSVYLHAFVWSFIGSFNPYNNCKKSTEKLSNLLKVTQLVNF